MSTALKGCQHCFQNKPLEEFYRNSTSKDGRQGYCKECSRTYRISRKTGGASQAGCAHHTAVLELRREVQNCKYLFELQVAMRQPKVVRLLKQIKLTDIFPELKMEVPPYAMVPAGFVFAD